MSLIFFESRVPQALVRRNRWLCWRSQLRNGKFTKAPINPLTGRPASICDSSTWSDFHYAKQRRDRFGCDGLGFVLNGDGVVAVDLDDCVTWEGDQFHINQQGEAIIRAIDSYAEFSPSRNGIHIFAFGSLPDASRRHNAARVEIYSSKQYVTVTGDLVPGCTAAIGNRIEELLTLQRRFFPKRSENLGSRHPVEARSTRGPGLEYGATFDDDALLNRARSAKNGARFRTLFDDGGFGEYSSDSEADLALCNLLAFWTGRDAERIDRLFRQSARMREKWNREDYRNRTISHALDRVQVTWQPRR